jgi:tetratricopeptide (TPR) repeat protein
MEIIVSATEQLFKEACRLNNDGARFLAKQDARNAVKSLKSALLVMSRLLAQELPTEGLTSAVSPRCSFVDVPGLDDAFYVFHRAFLLDWSQSMGTDLCFSNAAIVFNLALAFHQSGKAGCREDQLRRAAHFYGLAISLVANPSSIPGGLVFVALNNLAQIHYELLLEYDEALQLLDRAHELAGEIFDASAEACFGIDPFDEILLNIKCIQAPNTAPSA